MQKITLTLKQAHMLWTLDQQEQPWPTEYVTILNCPVPDKEDALLDPKRTAAGLAAIELGWSDEQIAIQLNYRQGGQAIRSLHRIREKLS